MLVVLIPTWRNCSQKDVMQSFCISHLYCFKPWHPSKQIKSFHIIRNIIQPRLPWVFSMSQTFCLFCSTKYEVTLSLWPSLATVAIAGHWQITTVQNQIDWKGLRHSHGSRHWLLLVLKCRNAKFVSPSMANMGLSWPPMASWWPMSARVRMLLDPININFTSYVKTNKK